MGYESIPINTIFRGMNIIYQLFLCSPGYKVLTHCQMGVPQHGWFINVYRKSYFQWIVVGYSGNRWIIEPIR